MYLTLNKGVPTQSVGVKNSLFMERLFTLFDTNHDGFLDLSEFLCGLSKLSTKVSNQRVSP